MRKLNTNEFVKRSFSKFGNRFDYSESEYKGMKVKVKIICKLHGEFWQTPDTHLNKGECGCPVCRLGAITRHNKTRDYSNRKYKISTKEDFLTKVERKYPNKFDVDLSNFTNIMMNDNISITCPLHGSFKIRPKYFISECNHYGCRKCGKEAFKLKKTIPYVEVINRSRKTFNDKYSYPSYNENKYININSKIDIWCDKHGLFTLAAQKHLEGRGCHRCKVEYMMENNLMVGGYSEEFFIKNPHYKDKPAFLYYLKINNGQYYKIGISKTSIYNRIKYLKSKAKKYNQLLNIKIVSFLERPLYECFTQEQAILKTYKDVRVFRRWSTELFSIDLLQNTTLEVITNSFPNLTQSVVGN